MAFPLTLEAMRMGPLLSLVVSHSPSIVAHIRGHRSPFSRSLPAANLGPFRIASPPNYTEHLLSAFLVFLFIVWLHVIRGHVHRDHQTRNQTRKNFTKHKG